MIEFALMLLIQQNFVDFAHGILPENFTGFVQQRDLVKMAVFDAVLALVQQPPLLDDEVPDGPGCKLFVEGVLHVVHQQCWQHLNLWVNLHLLLHHPGHLDPILKAAVTWNVNHPNTFFFLLKLNFVRK